MRVGKYLFFVADGESGLLHDLVPHFRYSQLDVFFEGVLLGHLSYRTAQRMM